MIIVVIGVMILAIIALAIMFWYITLPIIGLLVFFWKYPDWAEKRRREKEAKATRQYYADQEQKKREEEQCRRERSIWLEEQRKKDKENKEKQSWTIFSTKNDHPSSTKEKDVVKQKELGFSKLNARPKREHNKIYDKFEQAYKKLKQDLQIDDEISVGRCYTILGLQHDATIQQIKKRFRMLVLEYHPDKNKNTGKKFEIIHYAYKIIIQERELIA